MVTTGKKPTFLLTLPNICLGNFSAPENQTTGIIKMMATFSVHHLEVFYISIILYKY